MADSVPAVYAATLEGSMTDRWAVAIKVCIALAAIKAVWQLGGALGSLSSGDSPWPYFNDASPTVGMVAFALLYLREREARRKQGATRDRPRIPSP